MNLQIIIGIIVVIVILWGIISSRKRNLHQVHQEKESKQEEKATWDQEKLMTYGQVQATRQNLIDTINERLKDQPDKLNLLLELINEWADLKIKSFHERRSWIRKPDK